MKKITSLFAALCAMMLAAPSLNAQEAKPLEAKNAYAYDVKVEADETNATVSYRLNAPATKVVIEAYSEGEKVGEFEGKTLAEYTAEGQVNNLNTVAIPLSGFTKGKIIKFSVKVSSPIMKGQKCSKVYKYYHAAGVDVDLDPESSHFGRVLVAEAMTPKKAVDKNGFKYDSHVDNGGIGLGIYAFEPTLEGIKNANGSYGYTFGMNAKNSYESGKTAYDFRKVRISDDGRIFVARGGEGHSSIIEINPDDLNAKATELFNADSYKETYEGVDKDGKFIFAPNVSFDVRGSGKDLEIIQLSTNSAGIANSYSGYRTDVYKLGEAKTFEGLPVAYPALSGKYTISHTNTMIEYDSEGGVWYCNSRATASEKEPTLVHVNAEGVEDYKDVTTGRYAGGAVRFNPNNNLLYVCKEGGFFQVFEVTKDEAGKPVLTEKPEEGFETMMGRNRNDIAFDPANNAYVVGNSGEWFHVYSLPRANGDVTTPAASIYAVSIPGDATSVFNPEVTANVYTNNSTIFVEAEAGSMVEVYTIQGQRVYAAEAVSETTVIEGINSNVAIVRVNGANFKVVLR